MKIIGQNKSKLNTLLGACVLAACALPAAAADVTVNLTAQRMAATLPDGKSVPMWGYCATPAAGECAQQWAPGPTIVAAAGDRLTINLSNRLTNTATSIVIVGQIGGSLGSPTMVPSPRHDPQSVTWPVPGTAGDGTSFTPPAQPDRARAFTKEAAPSGAQTYVWESLKPGTYLYETGSHPSLQAPMGLYGVLVVTRAPQLNEGSVTPGQAYPGAYSTTPALTNVPHDASAVVLLSEIDPLQNAAVDSAAQAGADEYKPSNDPSCAQGSPCYPPAVNYHPTYFLVNGKAFDRSQPVSFTDPVPAAASSGNLLLRFVNAGLRTHIPSVVGKDMVLIAEDGHVAPGSPKVQSEVMLAAGKAFDVIVKPTLTDSGSAFVPASLALFDRQLSLSGDNQPDTGMQGFIQIAGGTAPDAAMPHAVDDTFTVPPKSSIFAANLLSNDVAIVNPTIASGPAHGTVMLNPDGTFTYTPSSGAIIDDTFTYYGNGKPALSATVRLVIDPSKTGGAPVANADKYSSNLGFGAGLVVSGSGVLGNDTDPSGYPLHAQFVAGSPGLTVHLNADGSFDAKAAASGVYKFMYRAVNSQGTASGMGMVTLSFGKPSGVRVSVVDAKSKQPLGAQDYRWTIEEDRTFHNAAQTTPSSSASDGPPNILGTNFHASYMPVVATGCTGPVSCGEGQTVNGAPVSETPHTPDQVVLDPNKYYYISVLPADAADADGSVPNSGHSMGGVAITPADIAAAGAGGQTPLQILVPPIPMKPAQLSVFVFEDNNPTNGAIDGAETSAGLGGFAVTIMDTAGRIGDVAGQTMYDVYNMPITNALFELDPAGCPRGTNSAAGPAGAENRIGVVYTCPEYDEVNDPQHRNRLPLAGHALIQNINPGRFDVMVAPGADRAAKGETWLQISTLEGTRANDAFAKSGEPPYFQEFGPPGFHAFVGFVNPEHVNRLTDPGTPASQGGLCNPSASNPNPCPNTVTGRVTNLHMSRPSQTELFDTNSNDILAGSTCYVGLNSQNGTGANIAVAQCDANGNFKFSNVPDGTYQAVVWDEWLDQIIQYKTVTVPASAGVLTTNMGNLPVLSWFTNIEQYAFIDQNGNGIKDPGEPGIPQIPMTVRYRDGSIGYISVTDSSGNGSINELFPLFNWYVTESDTTRYKGTTVTTVVDGGGPVDTGGEYAGILTSTYPRRPNDPVRSTIESFPGSTLSFGIQGFISQTNIINWGKVPYAAGENGGITGMVAYAATRGGDDPRLEVQFNWEPGIPRVKVRLYRVTTAPNGSRGLVFVKETTTSSWDDTPPANCPGQRLDDPFLTQTLGQNNVDKCYDGFHNWNQTRPAVYDGRYRFTDIPAGKYVVEVIPPEGYDIVKEEDKNILLGDAYEAAVSQQFAGVGNIFILPDQATVNAAARPEPGNAFPRCVGDTRVVPDFVSLFPGSGQVAPFAGASRPLCNRKEVQLNDQAQAVADFHLFTQTPIAAHYTGMILDDASSEFNAAAPDFGEKFGVPFVPVSMRDFNGVEISRVYADQWGMYNGLVPSTWSANVPNPSGFGPNMLTNCMNDPGPIKGADGKMVTDPLFNPMYSNFCYTNPFMPGSTTYLDTPVLPVAAFAAGYYPVDCSYPDVTPAIRRVDAVSGGFGPYLPKAGGAIRITALGDVEVPNPAYAGPSASSPPFNQKKITRHYGFGMPKGTVKLGAVELNVTSWSDSEIIAQVAPNTPTGQLVIKAASGKSSVDAVTVTVEDRTPVRVQANGPKTIQQAIDDALPGDLILIDEGSYNELVIMWKPVRLQGVGAASVIINAAKYPNEKLAAWRPRINALFGIDASGNQTLPAQVDPLPGQEITGGVVLLEPTVLSTEEGAGITVLAKDYPANHCSARPGDPSDKTWMSNFYCGGSNARIDGISVTGGDSGGGIYVNGWAHNLEISNNRVYGNAGTFTGGVRIGQPNLEGLEDLPRPFGFNRNIKVHHNAITTNGTVEAQMATSGAGGGLSLNAGSDNYSVRNNFICGNVAMGDGGGVAHVGYSSGTNTLSENMIIFNQSINQGATNSGGGVVVAGQAPVFGATSIGAGNVTVDANQIQGNHAASGHGGGIFLRDLGAGNGRVELTNNMIVNNVAGFSGGGISLQNAGRAVVVNNTVAHNDATATVGPAFTVQDGPATSVPQPAGISADENSMGATLTNNIVWENRSFFFAPAPGSATGFQLNPVVSGCGGSDTGANYWDFGVIGQPQANPARKLDPSFTLMTSTTGYEGKGNKTGDPHFTTSYCNAGRFVAPALPELPAPTVPFNMQTAGALDEGGNWVDVRYGPLSLSEPAQPGQPGTAKPPVGDYHVAVDSPAVDAGTTSGAPNHDFDMTQRFGRNDIGADEVDAPPPPPMPLPALGLLDDFNRQGSGNLGSKWSQATLFGLASISVNANEAVSLLTPGYAIWNVPTSGYGPRQGAAFKFVTAPVDGTALILKATGSPSSQPAHFLRVRLTGGQAVVETTDNAGLTVRQHGGVPGSFAAGDTISAVSEADGTVRVYKTTAAGTTQLGTVSIPITGAASWPLAASGGRIGLYLVRGQRVDNFAGGTIP